VLADAGTTLTLGANGMPGGLQFGERLNPG